ncbi:MAG: leucine-rich repeat domain-containing protein, partial [Treponemataceae bacterium]|nr:leucine-rich repeat domain-containing protein [Treponemataceae bacterium]
MKKKWIAPQVYGLLTSFPAEKSRMKKRCFIVLAAMVLAGSAFAAKFPSYLMVDGTTVTGVKNQKKLPANLVIPDGVTAIGDRAFSNCTSLTSVTIPDSVTAIGNGSIAACTSLSSVTIPNGVTKIGGSAFSGCSLLVSVTIPGSVTEIGYNAFDRCTSLASVTIPGSVITIGESAFYGCTSLANVTIPGSATVIGYRAFNGCTSLKEIQFKGTTAQWQAIQGSDQIQGPVVRCSDGHIGIEEVPEYLKIAGTAVTGYTDTIPANLVIPDGVTAIGERAFNYCTSLVSVCIPDSVTVIGNYAFTGCTSLTEIQFKGTTAQWRAIRGRAIQGSSETKKVATIRCSDGSLSAEEFPEYLKMEGTKVTGYTGTLPTSLVIPDGVTEIGSYAFNECTSIASVTIPDTVTVISDAAFKDCASLTSVIIPSSVKKISYCSFYRCISLTSVTIPDSVTTIGDGVFYGCTSLVSVIIPNGVTAIGYKVFDGCTSLAGLTIPDGVTEISNSAFQDCTSLKEIQFGGTTAQWKAIKGSDDVKIPCIRCIDGYIGVEAVPDYLKMDGTAVTGYIGTVPANLVIPDGVTEIGIGAFKNCTSFSSVTIPGSVTAIGESAFRDCTSLKKVQFGGTIAQWKALKGSDGVKTPY